jgi:hypothetical protein
MTGVGLNVLWDAYDEPFYSRPSVVGVVLVLLATAPALLRRRLPHTALGVALIGLAFLTIGGFSRWVMPYFVLPLIILNVGLRSRPLLAVASTAAALAVAYAAFRSEPYVEGDVGPALVLTLVPLAAGLAWRRMRQRSSAVETACRYRARRSTLRQ